MENKNNLLAIIDGKEYRLPENEEEHERIERLEDESLLKLLSGELLNTYVYSFDSKGKRVTDLSVKAIDTIAMNYGSIECGIEEIDISGPDCVVVAWARDKIRDLKRIAGFAQPKRYTNGQENPFAFTNAVRKAERNAIKELIPEPLKRTLILRFLAEQEKAELISVIESGKQRLREYGYDLRKFNEYCSVKFETIFDELDLDKAKKAAAFIVTAQARKELSISQQ